MKGVLRLTSGWFPYFMDVNINDAQEVRAVDEIRLGIREVCSLFIASNGG